MVCYYFYVFRAYVFTFLQNQKRSFLRFWAVFHTFSQTMAGFRPRHVQRLLGRKVHFIYTSFIHRE